MKAPVRCGEKLTWDSSKPLQSLWDLEKGVSGSKNLLVFHLPSKTKSPTKYVDRSENQAISFRSASRPTMGQLSSLCRQIPPSRKPTASYDEHPWCVQRRHKGEQGQWGSTSRGPQCRWGWESTHPVRRLCWRAQARRPPSVRGPGRPS